jgi:hypothetical protein
LGGPNLGKQNSLVIWGGLLSSEQNDEKCDATKMLRELKPAYIIPIAIGTADKLEK